MNKAIGTTISGALAGALLCGCISHNSTVYRDVERTPVDFETDAAARLFYETLSRNFRPSNHSESTVRVQIPIVFAHERKVIPGRNVEFNEAVAMCDSNKDGSITELEAQIFANQH